MSESGFIYGVHALIFFEIVLFRGSVNTQNRRTENKEPFLFQNRIQIECEWEIRCVRKRNIVFQFVS